MAAEEAFIFGCTAVDCDDITIKFDVDETHVGMTITFGDQATVDEDDQAAVYAELILASVCDSYEKDYGAPDAFPSTSRRISKYDRTFPGAQDRLGQGENPRAVSSLQGDR